MSSWKLPSDQREIYTYSPKQRARRFQKFPCWEASPRDSGGGSANTAHSSRTHPGNGVLDVSFRAREGERADLRQRTKASSPTPRRIREGREPAVGRPLLPSASSAQLASRFRRSFRARFWLKILERYSEPFKCLLVRTPRSVRLQTPCAPPRDRMLQHHDAGHRRPQPCPLGPRESHGQQ